MFVLAMVARQGQENIRIAPSNGNIGSSEEKVPFESLFLNMPLLFQSLLYSSRPASIILIFFWYRAFRTQALSKRFVHIGHKNIF